MAATAREKSERVKEIDAQISVLVDEKKKLVQEIAESVSEFKVGEHISWAYGKGRRNGVITNVRPKWGWGRPEYIVTPKRKDGSDGVSVAVSEYEKPERFPAANLEAVEALLKSGK